jgi:hypothetical protein
LSLLFQFVLRLSFGLAFAMAVTPPHFVPSGYYRVHSYVLLGLNALASLIALSDPSRFILWPALAAAVLSYISTVVWLYEKPRAGGLALSLVGLLSILAAWAAQGSLDSTPPASAIILNCLDALTGGLLLGTTMAAMLLGHWYLNTPTMQLAPLRRLVLLLAGAAILRAAVCGIGLALMLADGGMPDTARGLFIALRWLGGLIGVLILAAMTWQTLKIPNTQSATGILYVAVIGTFLGELTSQLLSAESAFPL